jgi:hypothetical protein
MLVLDNSDKDKLRENARFLLCLQAIEICGRFPEQTEV